MSLTRRSFLLKGAAGAIDHAKAHGGNLTVGEVDLRRLGFDPTRYLTQFDWGKATRLPNGRTLREYTVVAYEREIEIAPGVFFPAWVFNGTVPGPTLRAREGDQVRVKLINASKHPHTLHFHGFHKAEMDGVPGIGRGDVLPGGTFHYKL